MQFCLTRLEPSPWTSSLKMRRETFTSCPASCSCAVAVAFKVAGGNGERQSRRLWGTGSSSRKRVKTCAHLCLASWERRACHFEHSCMMRCFSCLPDRLSWCCCGRGAASRNSPSSSCCHVFFNNSAGALPQYLALLPAARQCSF